MKTVNLQINEPMLKDLLLMACAEPVLILTAEGKQFFISQADDFENEVTLLRESKSFQEFLDERASCKSRVPIEDVEQEIECEITRQGS